MKLKEFADLINECVKKAGDTIEHVDVEIYWNRFNDGEPWYFDIKSMGQFGIVPDVSIEIETDEWIRLNEKVPEEGEKVLWYDEMFDKVHAFALDYPEMHDGDYTHWMPLPAKPKKEE